MIHLQLWQLVPEAGMAREALVSCSRPVLLLLPGLVGQLGAHVPPQCWQQCAPGVLQLWALAWFAPEGTCVNYHH